MIGAVTASIRIVRRLDERGFTAKIREIAAEHHATIEEVTGKSHKHRIARARRACWAYLYGLGFSTPDIADLWSCDHSTVNAGLRAIGVARRTCGGKARAA